jgi:hypothetical protein
MTNKEFGISPQEDSDDGKSKQNGPSLTFSKVIDRLRDLPELFVQSGQNLVRLSDDRK